jgi:hypothetical protein
MQQANLRNKANGRFRGPVSNASVKGSCDGLNPETSDGVR